MNAAAAYLALPSDTVCRQGIIAALYELSL